MSHYFTSPFLLLLTLVFLAGSVEGQKERKPSISEFSAAVTHGSMKGYFHHLDSTGLYYAQTATDLRSASTIEHLPLTSLRTIYLRTKSSRVKGIGIGIAIGTLTGVVLGNVLGKKEEECFTGVVNDGVCTKSETVGLLTVSGAFLGGGLGALFGGEKVRFIIRGKKHRLRAQEKAIRKYEYKQ